MRNFYIDDTSPEDGAKLEVFTDNQGDIYLRIHNEDKSKSETVRFCGAGGGSRYPCLAGELAKVFSHNTEMRDATNE